MANNHRTVISVMKGIWIRLLSIIAQFTFPAHVTTAIHRLRGVHVGKGSKITRTVIIEDSRPDLITIGENVWITAGCQLLCHQRDLSYYHKDMPVMDCPLKYAPIVIKDGAHIGIGSIIMPGVTVGKCAVVGAGAVVTKDIPDYCLAVGVPAKVIKKLAE
ncbi:MAG: acyltransferase [Bacteroidales bacterium]|nr:acyltransferase [Candidatus Colimorpha merdihippi]